MMAVSGTVTDGWIAFALLVGIALLVSAYVDVRRARRVEQVESPVSPPPPFKVLWPESKPVDQDELGW